MLVYLNDKLAYRPYNHISLDQVKVHFVIYVPRTMPPVGVEAIRIMNSPEVKARVVSYSGWPT
jgi:hypothetical protein